MRFFRVYSGLPGSSDVARAREQALFKKFTSLNEALSFARHLEDGGRSPLLIEGDGGTRLTRREIGEALRHSRRETAGPAG